MTATRTVPRTATLPQKLGVEPGDRIAFDNRPPEFAAATTQLPRGVKLKYHVRGPLDMVIAFCSARKPLEQRMPTLTGALDDTGLLWIAWPCPESDVPTDLDEDVVRELAHAGGVVEIERLEIDGTWSALKFAHER
jgi:hypothetical protein